jgi:hypothetical protein
MSRITASRIRLLRLALQEAVRVGDELAVKRLTAKLTQLIALH